MAVNFVQLIDENKRRSIVLIVCFVAVLGVLGAVIGYALGLGSRHVDASQAVLISMGMGGAAMVMASVGSVASYFGGASAVLAASHAEPLAPGADPQLQNVVEEMAIAAGVPVPAIYVINDTSPNAFATGRDPQHAVIAITTGLREKLNRQELQGVIGHEMSHIKHYDIRFALLLTTLVGAIVLLCDFFLRSAGWGGRRRSSDRESGGLDALIFVLALLLAIIAPILAKILEMAFSRQREFLADAGSVELTRDPQGLISALEKISDDPDVLEAANRATAPLYIVHPVKSFEERASSMFDSHPPIRDRIARLQALT